MRNQPAACAKSFIKKGFSGNAAYEFRLNSKDPTEIPILKNTLEEYIIIQPLAYPQLL